MLNTATVVLTAVTAWRICNDHVPSAWFAQMLAFALSGRLDAACGIVASLRESAWTIAFRKCWIASSRAASSGQLPVNLTGLPEPAPPSAAVLARAVKWASGGTTIWLASTPNCANMKFSIF